MDEPSKNKIALILLVVVVVLVVIIMGPFGEQESEQEQDDQPILSDEVIEKSVVELSLEDLKDLKEETGMQWKMYSEYDFSDFDELPDALKTLVVSNENVEVEVEKALDHDGSRVFLIDYKIEMPFADIYKLLLANTGSAGWQVTYDKATSIAAFVELSRDEYQAAVDFVSLDEESTHVIINVVNKP